MGALSCLAGCIIVLINIIFLILGLVFTGVGALLKFGAPFLTQYIKPIIEGTLKAIEDLVPGAELKFADLIKSVFDIASSLAVALLVLGILFLILSITGMCGVCCSSKTLIIIFCCVNGVLLIGVLSVTVWSYKSNIILTKLLKEPFQSLLKNYKGVGSFDANTLIIDFANLMFKCCGVNNGSDFDDIKWNREVNYTINGERRSLELVYPVSCCKMDGSKKPIDANCTFEPTLNNSNYDVGCWNRLTDDILGYFSYLNFGLFGICGFFAILLALGLVVICSDKNNKVSDSA